MNDTCQTLIWHQFGAAIDTLKNAINACPDDLWGDNSKSHPFWYVTYHTLFWLDYYVSQPVENFTPPEPYTLSELDPAGALPDRTYTKAELLDYLKHCRAKCRTTILNATDDQMEQLYHFKKADLPIAELWLYNMRHVQHHAAQLNLILRKAIDSAPGWVFAAAD